MDATFRKKCHHSLETMQQGETTKFALQAGTDGEGERVILFEATTGNKTAGKHLCQRKKHPQNMGFEIGLISFSFIHFPVSHVC